MLSLTWQTVRLFLHVLAATVWVGGQLTLAALVPALRAFDREVTRVAARRFNQVAWVAFAVLVATGVWNILALPPMAGAYRTTLIVKLCVVAASGGTAYLHMRARGRTGPAVFGALTGVTAVGALLLGVMLG